MTRKASEIVRRARRVVAAEEVSLTDPRVDRVLGFLVAKGLLLVPGIIPQPRVKLRIEDVLFVAAHVEPRVLEVFPSAYIHYPRSFVNTRKIPAALKKIIRAIQRGVETGEDFAGIEYRGMKRWADYQARKIRTV